MEKKKKTKQNKKKILRSASQNNKSNTKKKRLRTLVHKKGAEWEKQEVNERKSSNKKAAEVKMREMSTTRWQKPRRKPEDGRKKNKGASLSYDVVDLFFYYYSYFNICSNPNGAEEKRGEDELESNEAPVLRL